jgi:hypothetical protein
MGSAEKGTACGILMGKPQGKRPLGRFRLRREINIKIDFKEIGLGGTDWTHLTQDKG